MRLNSLLYDKSDEIVDTCFLFYDVDKLSFETLGVALEKVETNVDYERDVGHAQEHPRVEREAIENEPARADSNRRAGHIVPETNCKQSNKYIV